MSFYLAQRHGNINDGWLTGETVPLFASLVSPGSFAEDGYLVKVSFSKSATLRAFVRPKAPQNLCISLLLPTSQSSLI